MNCANHPDTGATAYCRTCGKALCPQCTRDVRGVIYCENCLAARLEGAAPQQTVYQQVIDPGTPYQAPATPGSGPNPALAGILAGFFPFGVGAVYTSQYAKGLAHLLIFVGIIFGLSHGGGGLGPILGIAMGFFYVYQIIDAVRSAKAIQMGQPPPDPFGLARTFGSSTGTAGVAATGSGERSEESKTPIAAIILIGLGVLFLINTTGILDLDIDRIWPVALILLGLWLGARRLGYVGSATPYDCQRCATRGLMGPAVLVTVGLLSLLESTSRYGWDRTWPLLLVVIGLVKFLQSSASDAGHQAPPVQGPPAVITNEVAPPSTEVKHG
jgi:hypothetical protein